MLAAVLGCFCLMPEQKSYILLTIDVEDWFQVENFKPWIPFSAWSSKDIRVEKNVHQILDLLDSIRLNNLTNQSCHITPKATFFILGWIAKRLPCLVKEIHKRGHEVASHGYYHNLCYSQSCKDLTEDLCSSKKLLEDIVGVQVAGYRAPNFSINQNVLKIIEKCGYLYDSSYNSFAGNNRYGQIDLSGYSAKGIAYNISNKFYELPVSNLKLKINNILLPWAGGGYFRLLPFFIFKHGVKKILRNDKTYMFYFHPWEIDYDQPVVEEAALFSKFRHYINLNKTHFRLSKMIKLFKQNHFITCKKYIKEQYLTGNKINA